MALAKIIATMVGMGTGEEWETIIMATAEEMITTLGLTIPTGLLVWVGTTLAEWEMAWEEWAVPVAAGVA